VPLHFASLGSAACHYSRSAGAHGEQRLTLCISAVDGRVVRFVNGSNLSDHLGTLQIKCLTNEACGSEDADGNVIFWNDPGKDEPSDGCTHYSLQLHVEQVLYGAILNTVGSQAVLEVEVEVPDIKGESVQFEALYGLGMSRVAEYSIVLRAMDGRDAKRRGREGRLPGKRHHVGDGRTGPGIVMW
jgi:hypothetical protein